MASTVARMTDPANRLADDADVLRATAQRLHDHTLDPASIPLTFATIEGALRVLSRTAYAAAHALVPPGTSDDSVADRYARAAAVWPSPRRGVAPTHEQQARVLASLHDAGAALRAAGAHCGRAAESVAATMESSREELRSEAA